MPGPRLSCIVGLLIPALALGGIRLGFPLVRALPATSEEARAQTAAAKGFVPGILSPTEILVLGPGVAAKRPALARMQHALATQPGVAGVVGPADLPRGNSLHLILARSGNAARYGLMERTDPLGPTAIDRIRTLRKDLPSIARSSGLTGVRFEVGGETAISSEAIDAARADLGRIALVVLFGQAGRWPGGRRIRAVRKAPPAGRAPAPPPGEHGSPPASRLLRLTRPR